MKVEHMLREVKTKASSTYMRLSYRRKARVYCVGTAKSGTHSIAEMFDNTVRSGHEPEYREVIQKIFEITEGKMSESAALSYVRARDKRLCLDIDSSQLNFFILGYLLEAFPDARFILTIRDCYSWLDSFINHSLRRNARKEWIALRDYRFQAHTLSHPSEEQALKERGLYTLDGYLSYWAHHNHKVLSSIPQDRLMVLKTKEITQSAQAIAAFTGLPKETILLEKSHAFKNPEKYNVLREIEEAHLEAKVHLHCGDLMSRFFPEIRSARDAKI